MKKITILFLAFLMLFSANVFAASYDLWVADVQVNNVNKDDILGDGKVTYDPTTNTLTLEDANINATDDGIHNEIENLTINLLGENTISAGDDGIESYEADFTIIGNGSLTINANYGIYQNYSNLTIENTTVTANGSQQGIFGIYGNSEILSITNSTVKATGTNYGSISYMYNLVLNGCAITQPEGAEFNASQYAVVDANGDIVTTEVVIEPGIAPTYYDLWVAGVRVNNVNKDDITSAVNQLGNPNISASGSVSYDPTTNTLTLDGANIISYTYEVSISNDIANLTIRLVGENHITTELFGIKSTFADLTITGNGSLTINAMYGIYHDGCNLTIDNTTVTAVGESRGICGYEGNNEVLTINNSTVRATGTDDGSIRYINDLILNGCFISQPDGAVFDENEKGVFYNGEIVKGEIIIGPSTYYDLIVGDIPVTDLNKNNITSAINQFGIYNQQASGTITYNPTTNILTLDNATLDLTGLYLNGISNYIPNLTINLIGENSISTANIGIESDENFRITGTGSLTINAVSIGLLLNLCNLTIENTTVTAIGSDWGGICGQNGNNEILTITNSTVKATGTEEGSIRYINDLVLNGCEITQPEGAEFNASQKAVYLNGNIVKTEVVIEPIAPATYTVSGMVAENGVGLAGVTISYTGGSTTTAANGTYSFTSQANTTHTVTPSKAGYTFTPASLTVNVAEANVTEQNFIGTAVATTYTVSGTVTNGTNPLADVTITYNGGSTTTASDGTFSFAATANTTYTITPSKVGYTFNPASKTVNVAQADITGQDFVGTAVATYTVSGTVKAITDDSPIEGVTITYNGGGINGTTTTAANGTYSFIANANTTYTVAANKTGYSFLPTTKTVNVVVADVTGIDFHGTVTYNVEGIVKDATNDNPIAGVTITYTGGTTTTASDGTFSFAATANTSYTVTPSKVGYTFNPASKTVNVTNADVIGVTFYGTADGTPVDETEINAITVYPNPASDYIKVAGLTGNEEILVFDINGRIVKTLQANDNIETISINDLAKGSYMIKVRKENKIEVLKFIK